MHTPLVQITEAFTMATHEKQKRSLGFFNIFYKSSKSKSKKNNNIPKPNGDRPNVVPATNPMLSPAMLLPRKSDYCEEITTSQMMSSPAISLPRNSDYYYYGEETIKTMMSPMVVPMKSPNSCYFNGHQDALGEEADDGPRRSLDGGRGRKMLAGDAGRKSVSHVEANLASVVAFLQVKVLVTDMPGHMQVHAFRCARRTFDSLERFSSKHMAYNMKKEFDKVYGPAWHCIVGPSFGSFVTHSTGCFLYFTMEKLYILVFKTKVQRAMD